MYDHLKEKALDFAKELNITDFKVSERWLDLWKNRHNVVFRTVSGKKRLKGGAPKK